VAIWYVDPTIAPSAESDSFDGGFGTGLLRDSWADVTLASADSAYGRGGTVGVLGPSKHLLFSGSNGVLGTYGGGGWHVLDGSAVTSQNYTVRFQGTNQRLREIVIFGNVTGNNGIQIGSGMTGLVMERFALFGPGQSATVSNNQGILDGSLNALTIRDFEIRGYNTGIGMGGYSGTTLAQKLIVDGLIHDFPLLAPADSDGITIGGTVRDHEYKTVIRRIRVRGCYENGIDLGSAERVVVEDCDLRDPADPNQPNAGMLFGASAGSNSRHRIHRVKSIGFDNAFATRGGGGNEMRHCVGIGRQNGLTIGGGTSPADQSVDNCYLVGADSSGLRVFGTAASGGHVIRNTVLTGGVRGATVDAGCAATITSCVSPGPLSGGAGTVTDGGGNTANAPVTWTDEGALLPGSPLLTQGVRLGYRRDINGRQCDGHIGAHGAARLLRT